MSDLAAALFDLGAHLDQPVAADLPSRVAASIRTSTPTRDRVRVAAWVAALLAVVGVTFAPAVADLLDVGAVRVRQAPPPATALGAPLDLGRPVSLAEAATIAGFTPRLPRALGVPDEVWVDTRPLVPIVALVYGRTVLYEIGATLAEDIVVNKFAPSGAVFRVRVGSDDGLWIDGLHEVGYLTAGGDYVNDRVRIAGPVLLWQHDAITYRLETHGSQAEAIAIAESVP